MTSTESLVPATDEALRPDPDGAADQPPGSAAPAEAGADQRLAALEAGLAAGLAAVAERLAQDTARAEARERVIDRQHAEIERLRSVERVGQLRPVVTDLYRLRNDLLRQAATTPAESTGAQVTALLRSYADDVADALERCGVTVTACAVGAAFEPGRHQVAAVVPTTDPARDGTVAEIVQDGYAETEGRVIAPTRVTLYRCSGCSEEDTDG